MNDWLLVFKYACLLGWLAYSCCRCLFVQRQQSQPEIYTTTMWILVTFLRGEHNPAWSTVLNKDSYAQTLSQDDLWLCKHNHWLILNSSIYPISLTRLGSTCDMVLRHFPMMPPAGTIYPSWYHLLDDDEIWTIFQGWNDNALTTQPCTYSLLYVCVNTQKSNNTAAGIIPIITIK